LWAVDLEIDIQAVSMDKDPSRPGFNGRFANRPYPDQNRGLKWPNFKLTHYRIGHRVDEAAIL
jgi:hypothetical protein